MRAGGAGPERRGRNQPKGVESSGSIGGRKGGSRSPRTLTWWPNGTLKADGVWRYFYDERGALTAVYPAANSASSRRYIHDALGGRRRETHATTTEADTDTEIWTSTDGLRPEITIERLRSRPGAATNPWVDTSWMISVLGPNPDERLLYVDATPAVDLVSYPHTDRRGSTVALTRAGAATQTFRYGPYGESTDSTAGYPWRYTGQRLDPVTGLYHYKARDYSASWGRFLQPDPAGFVDGPNLYAYVGGDPLNLTDPSGLCMSKSGKTLGSDCEIVGRTQGSAPDGVATYNRWGPFYEHWDNGSGDSLAFDVSSQGGDEFGPYMQRTIMLSAMRAPGYGGAVADAIESSLAQGGASVFVDLVIWSPSIMPSTSSDVEMVMGGYRSELRGYLRADGASGTFEVEGRWHNFGGGPNQVGFESFDFRPSRNVVRNVVAYGYRLFHPRGQDYLVYYTGDLDVRVSGPIPNR